ncbi:MAG: pantetheine-phosphate adenylyltransferase [Bacteroidia bacterium]|nr:pantetheine-phosphate adenylyltransferase [Bacteroidia bacterium]MBP7260749.1 pantetheine-phosphate adenylyltransferase [Bacteroidia bacterium]MBP9179908.1 pantetheine-phosphate adenylyltransferase [Bacteroidia bacterium]MBP9724183.1 pantetheine-phosphate adenylyltransferase [Bacteroidia bacterium]
MKRIALVPGTFDPITIGHVDIINRALPMFDELWIGIGRNSIKQSLFTEEERKGWIEAIYQGNSKVHVDTYEGLTTEFCRKIGAHFIIRGIRTSSDFDYEKNIAQMNKAQYDDIESIFLMCNPAFTAISSTIVRDIIRNGGDARQFVPKEVKI